MKELEKYAETYYQDLSCLNSYGKHQTNKSRSKKIRERQDIYVVKPWSGEISIEARSSIIHINLPITIDRTHMEFKWDPYNSW